MSRFGYWTSALATVVKVDEGKDGQAGSVTFRFENDFLAPTANGEDRNVKLGGLTVAAIAGFKIVVGRRVRVEFSIDENG